MVLRDGCNKWCNTETGWSCSGGTTSTKDTCSTTCGNGYLDANEVCDDGNTSSSDGCMNNCSAVEKGFVCNTQGSACTPICGDGYVRGDEECDDGDIYSGDGCSRECTVERSYTCTSASTKVASNC